MRKMITGLSAIATLAAATVLAAPTAADDGTRTAAKGIGIHAAAKMECKDERADDPREFAVRYGGTGKAALKRCIRAERRDATRDCKLERRYETNEFIAEYGGKGKKALRRCIIDELL